MKPTVLALLGGFALDAAVGELPTRVHPVAWLGRLVARLDRPWDRPRLAGALLALGLPLAAAGLVGGVVLMLGRGSFVAGTVAGALVVFVTTSCRRLVLTVREVSELADTDLAGARSALMALAGRDAGDLSRGELRSAALESLAENYVDGLVAPLWWFLVGAALATASASVVTAGDPPGAVVLAGACAGAVWLKAVNTLDSMVGYPDKPWGTAAARLDDAAMWMPARLGAALLALVWGSPGALARARVWSTDVASPNSGWPMGVLAAGMDVRLTKPGSYDLNHAARLPTGADVDRALGRVVVASVLAVALAGVVAWY